MASSLVRTVTRSCSAHLRRQSTTASATPAKTRYQLAVSVVVERPAVLTPPLTDLQRSVADLMMRLENEASLKSDHELRLEKDAELAEKRKAGKEVAKEAGGLKSALDDEDDWKRELEEFRTGVLDSHVSHVAGVSAKSDRKALTRVYDRPLRLLVKQQWGVSAEWDLPKVTHVRGETLRQAAERAIVECCGQGIKANVLGNAPFGFYKFKFPRRLQEKLGFKGQKVFIYKALYSSGAVALQKDKTLDYEWLVLDEMLPALDERVAGSLEDMLYNDEP